MMCPLCNPTNNQDVSIAFVQEKKTKNLQAGQGLRDWVSAYLFTCDSLQVTDKGDSYGNALNDNASEQRDKKKFQHCIYLF